MDSKKFKVNFNGEDLEIEIGKLAEQATAAVTAKWGDTVVLASVVVSEEAKEGADFFPMMVDYEERWFATGKISGSRYIKRETRPSDDAVLASRMIDRPIRPLFPKNYRNDVQIIITVLSADLEHDPAIVSLIATSTALMITPAPFKGPVGAVRIGKIDGKLIVNPLNSQLENSDIDLVVSATEKGINMLEGKTNQITEKEFVEACKIGYKAVQPILKLQKEIQKQIKVEKQNYVSEQEKIEEKIIKYVGKKIESIMPHVMSEKKEEAVTEFEKDVLMNFEGDHKQLEIKSALDSIIKKELRKNILYKKIRPDGRKPDEIRPITIEVGLLPRTHGSALFKRGQTQVLSVSTLASPSRELVIETMGEEATKRYMHHYNFPPFSVGEISPLRGVSRREIGHGALAEKALEPVIPDRESFPYTIRVASEVLSSNGSTSMASVCGSSLSLMDAGVPIKSPVAGISIGMVSDDNPSRHGRAETGKYLLLTDIIGPEDFSGDMDFKIAGTEKGITAIQLDIKKDYISMEVVEEAAEKAKNARLQILEKMNKVLPGPRKLLSKYAPIVSVIKINPSKIRDVIGPGGKIINEIIDKTNSTVDVEQDGSVTISSQNPGDMQKAKDWISSLTHEVKAGETFKGKVTRIMDFGAFVEVLPGQEGLVHISQLAPQRVEKVTDIVKVGDIIPVKVLEIDSQGRINLSLKAMQEKK
jgi:polyribonucleotide nucleotidyltransferase